MSKNLLLYIYLHGGIDKSTYIQRVGEEKMRRRDRRIPCSLLTNYKYSSFRHLYLSGNDQALLNATGYDHPTFLKLVMKFKRYFYLYKKDSKKEDNV